MARCGLGGPCNVRTADFRYALPRELIAQRPLLRRRDSRLLALNERGALRHLRFEALPGLLRPDDLLVLNDTRVLPARLRCRRRSGARVSIQLVDFVDERRARAQLRAGGKPRDGETVTLEGGALSLRLARRDDGFWELEFPSDWPARRALERFGRTPLPPYIERDDEPGDRERYQTVFAKRPGAVAAPTAGLHFDRPMLDRLARQLRLARVTLHVGPGTYQPVRAEDAREHAMHAEAFEVPEATCRLVDETRRRGGRVVAVGTTVVRALESAWRQDGLAAARGHTKLFILPGHRFASVDAMLTNFHQPGSTLLMLLAAFVGRERMLAAYREAVARRYRFLSYGDAMFAVRQA